MPLCGRHALDGSARLGLPWRGLSPLHPYPSVWRTGCGTPMVIGEENIIARTASGFLGYMESELFIVRTLFVHADADMTRLCLAGKRKLADLGLRRVCQWFVTMAVRVLDRSREDVGVQLHMVLSGPRLEMTAGVPSVFVSNIQDPLQQVG
jgi:hypothetical protein